MHNGEFVGGGRCGQWQERHQGGGRTKAKPTAESERRVTDTMFDGSLLGEEKSKLHNHLLPKRMRPADSTSSGEEEL